jgi:hypothetical protein
MTDEKKETEAETKKRHAKWMKRMTKRELCFGIDAHKKIAIDTMKDEAAAAKKARETKSGLDYQIGCLAGDLNESRRENGNLSTALHAALETIQALGALR